MVPSVKHSLPLNGRLRGERVAAFICCFSSLMTTQSSKWAYEVEWCHQMTVTIKSTKSCLLNGSTICFGTTSSWPLLVRMSNDFQRGKLWRIPLVMVSIKFHLWYKPHQRHGWETGGFCELSSTSGPNPNPQDEIHCTLPQGISGARAKQWHISHKNTVHTRAHILIPDLHSCHFDKIDSINEYDWAVKLNCLIAVSLSQLPYSSCARMWMWVKEKSVGLHDSNVSSALCR